MNDNRCVCCGAVIPEGRQVCYKCNFKRILVTVGLVLSVMNPMPVKAEQHDMGTLVMDVDFNGTIDGRDATLVLTEYARTSIGYEATFTRTQQYIADADCDGQITAVDASHILSTYAITSSGRSMPCVTVVFEARERGAETPKYQAYSIEEVERYVNSNDAQLEIVANATVWMENRMRTETRILEG